MINQNLSVHLPATTGAAGPDIAHPTIVITAATTLPDVPPAFTTLQLEKVQ